MDAIIEFGKEVKAKLLSNGFDLSEPVEIGRLDFEGEGDSGYVQPLDCDLHSISEIADKWTSEIEDWGNSFVNNASPGWEINGGGEGYVVLSIDNNEVKAAMEMSKWYSEVTNYTDGDCYIPLDSEDGDCWVEIVDLWATSRPKSNEKLNIKVIFEGSGDSGSIDDIAIYKEGEHHYCNSSFSDDFVRLALSDGDVSVDKVIENWAYAILDRTGIDWENNDGGEGYINVFIDDIIEEDGEKKIRYEWSIDSRYGESDHSTYEETFNLADNGGE